MKALFTKDLNSLRPCGDEAEAMLAKLKLGDAVMVEFKRNRNPYQHRLFFALLRLVFENQETYASQEALRKAFLIYVGLYDTFQTKEGVIVATPKSMSFSNMDQGTFDEKVFQPFADFVRKHVIPGIDIPALREEAKAMIAPT